MVFRQLVNQDRVDSGITLEQGIEYAKVLFKSNNKPYILKDSVDGPLTKVVFTEHFIMVMREANSNECMAKMSKLEKYTYWDYVTYSDLLISIGIANPGYTDEQLEAAALISYRSNREYNTPENVVVAMNSYILGEVLELDLNSCYDNKHTW